MDPVMQKYTNCYKNYTLSYVVNYLSLLPKIEAKSTDGDIAFKCYHRFLPLLSRLLIFSLGRMGLVIQMTMGKFFASIFSKSKRVPHPSWVLTLFWEHACHAQLKRLSADREIEGQVTSRKPSLQIYMLRGH